jgi:TonB family protein
MRLLALLLAAALPALVVAEDPAAAEPQLAAPPSLRKNVTVDLPPGTAFPSPEVTVVLALEIDAEGKVTGATLEQGAGEPFDAAALAAAPGLGFEPARLTTGEAVPVTLSFRMRILAPPPPPPEAPRVPPVKLAGTLLERGTRRPLAGVLVEARAGEKTLAQGSTDAAGRFALSVPEAEFTLLASPPGHARLEAPVRERPGAERDETFYLEPLGAGFRAEVTGERIRREITRQVLSPEEIGLVAGTQGDTLKAVLNLPGAARPAFGGGNLVLRGSSPGDSAVFIEGLEIPVLYHFGGLRSTFAPRFLESVEFVPGNFAADYGRLTGGIVNVRVRDPKDDAVRGEADFNLYDAGVAVEGPLGKGWSGGAAFRRSWVDAILPAVLPKDSPLSFTSAPRFYDYQFLATWKPDGPDKVRLLFFGSQDKLVAIFDRPADDPSITGDLRFRVAFHELQASWAHVFSPALRQESWVALGLTTISTRAGTLFFDLSTRRVDARSTWVWQALPGLEARGGLDVQFGDASISLDVPLAPREGENQVPVGTLARIGTSKRAQLFQPAAFAELRWTPVEGLDVLPAVRADWTRALERWSVDPRLAVRWRVAEATVLKAAAGVFQQTPEPGETDSSVGATGLRYRRSLQTSAGFEQGILPGLDLDVTGFAKSLDRLVVRNLATETDPAAPRYLSEGKGRIYGLELLLRAKLGERFRGFVAYTFQRSLRTDRPGEGERRFDFDQPHILTVLGTWVWNPRWTFGARFRLVSGNPDTPVTGSVYDAAADVYVPLYGPTNSTRLGAFHALDLRADRTWTFDRWKLSAYLDVQNVYNRGNPEGWQYRYDYRERTPLTGLPILPILGLKGEW